MVSTAERVRNQGGIVLCGDCGRQRPHKGRGLCGACYERRRRRERLPFCSWPQGCGRLAVDGDRCRVHAVLEDAIWLLDCGETPDQVSHRIRMPLATLEGMLRRENQRVHYPAVLAAYKAERRRGGETRGELRPNSRETKRSES